MIKSNEEMSTPPADEQDISDYADEKLDIENSLDKLKALKEKLIEI
jgi:hypothetical protein